MLIWREQSGTWQKIFDFPLHKASVNAIAWSPHEVGCLLACASSDGSVSVLEFRDNSFDHATFPAHGLGVNSVSWAPATVPGSVVSPPQTVSPTTAAQRRFATGGCDNLVRIWAFDPTTGTYRQDGEPLAGHTDWVRDVAWSPTVLHKSYVASAGQDRTVRIWTNTGGEGGAWQAKVIPFDSVVWRVSWSLSGNVLAVSGADNKVTLWKETLRGEWDLIKTISE